MGRVGQGLTAISLGYGTLRSGMSGIESESRVRAFTFTVVLVGFSLCIRKV